MHSERDIMKFLDWAVESNRLDLFQNPNNTVTSIVNLPEGWGASSDETIGVKIYFRGRKLLRSDIKNLVSQWVHERDA